MIPATDIREGGVLYETRRIAGHRFSKVAVNVLKVHGDGFVTVAYQSDGRARRWPMAAVQKLKKGAA